MNILPKAVTKPIADAFSITEIIPVLSTSVVASVNHHSVEFAKDREVAMESNAIDRMEDRADLLARKQKLLSKLEAANVKPQAELDASLASYFAPVQVSE